MVTASGIHPEIVRFERFEANLASGELWRSGVRVSIQEKPFQVLRLLLEARGRVVTREQLRTALWPQDTFVDFDLGVNTAVRKVRQALEDSAERPHYVETLPKVGYRFIAPVEWVVEEPAVPTPGKATPVPAGTGPIRGLEESARPRRWREVAVLAGLLGLAGAGGLGYLGLRGEPAPKVSEYVQLTHDGRPKFLAGSDGERLYVGIGVTSARSIAEVSTLGGEPRTIPTPPGTNLIALNLSPNGQELMARDMPTGLGGQLWILHLPDGAPRRLDIRDARFATWSPDGGRLAYSNLTGDLFVANGDGSGPRKVAALGERYVVHAIAWSPDGSYLRFTAPLGFDGIPHLWQISVNGQDLHRLPLGLSKAEGSQEGECCGRWTSDGRFYVFEARGQIWAMAERRSWFGGQPKPFVLTSSPTRLRFPLPGKDGTKLYVVGQIRRGELMRHDAKSGQFLPFMGGMSAEYQAFSHDGKWVAYVTYPEGSLWRSRVDGSERLQLTYPPDGALVPRWSPDDKTILFHALGSDHHATVYEVAPEGGTPQRLYSEDGTDQTDPNWSPDGKKIVYGAAVGTESEIRVLDLETHTSASLPGSAGFFSPRWCAGGSSILALTHDQKVLMRFDAAAQKWTVLGQVIEGFPNCSWDGNSVYVLSGAVISSVLKISLKDGRVESVADLRNFPTTGRYEYTLALTPDDSPLILRDVGTQDIYALDWKEP